MNPKLKLLGLITISTCTLFINNLLYTFFIFLGIIFGILLLRIHLKFLGWIKFILIICGFIILLQTFTYSGIGFSVQGLLFGVMVSFRLLILMLVVFTFVYTTPAKQLTQAFDFLPKEITLMLTLAFRLLPTIKEELVMIINAQTTRGLNFKNVNFFKTYFPILIPLFGKTLERSNYTALAMESRGFKTENI